MRNANPSWALSRRMGHCTSSFQNMKLSCVHCSELGKLIKNSIENGAWASWKRWLSKGLFILFPSLQLTEMNSKNEK